MPRRDDIHKVLIIGEGFALSPSICFVVMMLYMIDVSSSEVEKSA